MASANLLHFFFLGGGKKCFGFWYSPPKNSVDRPQGRACIVIMYVLYSTLPGRLEVDPSHVQPLTR